MIPTSEVVQVLSLPVAGAAIYFMYKLATNHIEHNNEAVNRLTDAVISQTETNKEFHGWLKGWVSRDEKEKNAS